MAVLPVRYLAASRVTRAGAGAGAMGRSAWGQLRYAEDVRTLGFGALCAASIASQWRLRDLSAETWPCLCALLLLTTFQVFQGGVSVVRLHVGPLHRAQAHLRARARSTTRRTVHHSRRGFSTGCSSSP